MNVCTGYARMMLSCIFLLLMSQWTNAYAYYGEYLPELVRTHPVKDRAAVLHDEIVGVQLLMAQARAANNSGVPWWIQLAHSITYSTIVLISPTFATAAAKMSSTIQKIFLWTPSYKQGLEYELLEVGNSSSIIESHFLPNKPTYIVVHGFLGNGLEPWIYEIKDKLLRKEACNVISVQWPSGWRYFVIDYYHVTGHVPVVGQEIAKLLQMIDKHKGLSTMDIHMIGHSLGAHIAGFTGKTLNTTIARITGLDPAGLLYYNTDAKERLDKSDAAYVDVIHTNGCRNYLIWTDCFGINMNIGHTDYWPNGGLHQPACQSLTRNGTHRDDVNSNSNKTGSASVRWSIGCDHLMSHTYFLESLNYSGSSELFLAQTCDSYDQYTTGNCSCGRVPQYMGYHANYRGTGNYYLNTSSTKPYALPDHTCPPGTNLYSAVPTYALLYLLLLVPLLLFARCIVSVIYQVGWGTHSNDKIFHASFLDKLYAAIKDSVFHPIRAWKAVPMASNVLIAVTETKLYRRVLAGRCAKTTCIDARVADSVRQLRLGVLDSEGGDLISKHKICELENV
uniref:Inactive pancreatic lipase-related protein 1-like n=1 Tax=Hirondellea gigas TaxID=1518452 RepID=A0A6A7G9Y3_9CRUS